MGARIERQIRDCLDGARRSRGLESRLRRKVKELGLEPFKPAPPLPRSRKTKSASSAGWRLPIIWPERADARCLSVHTLTPHAAPAGSSEASLKVSQ